MTLVSPKHRASCEGRPLDDGARRELHDGGDNDEGDRSIVPITLP
jgi:hypothetical protein